jgi:hypothetical protein
MLSVEPPTHGPIRLQKKVDEAYISNHEWLALTPLGPTHRLWVIEKRERPIELVVERSQATQISFLFTTCISSPVQVEAGVKLCYQL